MASKGRKGAKQPPETWPWPASIVPAERGLRTVCLRAVRLKPSSGWLDGGGEAPREDMAAVAAASAAAVSIPGLGACTGLLGLLA